VTSELDSSTWPTGSRALLGEIRRRGWPLTKASYVRAMYSPDIPPFPLEQGIAESVPDALPGKLPTSVLDLPD
jgi:hypothetical protein